jgi:hypothetical protein
VKRLCADDSAATSVKVGYRQASYKKKPAEVFSGLFCFPKRHHRPAKNLTFRQKILL